MEGVYFFIFLLSMVFIILAVYVYVKRAEEGLRKKDKAEVFYPQLKREMTDEKNFVATHAKNAYIQNNARPISKRICILGKINIAGCVIDISGLRHLKIR